jgi:hypothetical protein
MMSRPRSRKASPHGRPRGVRGNIACPSRPERSFRQTRGILGGLRVICESFLRPESTKEHKGPGKSTRQGSTSFGVLENASFADEPEATTPTRETRREGWRESIVLFSAFQKSTVFETVTKHRETVAEGNVFERRPRSCPHPRSSTAAAANKS